MAAFNIFTCICLYCRMSGFLSLRVAGVLPADLETSPFAVISAPFTFKVNTGRIQKAKLDLYLDLGLNL